MRANQQGSLALDIGLKIKKKIRKGKGSSKLVRALGLGAAPLPAAGSWGDCSSCPHENHPVPSPGAGTGPWGPRSQPGTALALGANCAGLSASGFVLMV